MLEHLACRARARPEEGSFRDGLAMNLANGAYSMVEHFPVSRFTAQASWLNKTSLSIPLGSYKALRFCLVKELDLFFSEREKR